MLHAKLVTSGHQTKRQKLIGQIIREVLKTNKLKVHPDLIVVKGENSISIDQIRKLKAKLALKPYSADTKVALVLEAEKMSLPAQNSFLKTLEEPPENSLIILETTNVKLLLPTIVSRCQIIKLNNVPQIQTQKEELKKHHQIINDALKANLGKRLKLAAFYVSNRQEATDFVQYQLFCWRQKVLKEKSKTAVFNLRLTQKILQMLKANTNPLLSLGNLFLNYQPCPKTKNQV